MRRRTLALLTVSVLWVAAGCADGDRILPALSGPEQPAGAYLSTSVTEDGAPKTLPGDTRIMLDFRDGRLLARAACNSLSATARLDGQRLHVEDLVTTEMGCDPQRHDLDRWLAAFLQSGPAWERSGSELTLTGGTIVVRLVDKAVAQPAKPLTGTRWDVTTIVTGELAGSVPQGVEAFLTFGTDGTVTGSTGCNTLNGPARISGQASGTITFGPIVSTRRACTDDGLAALETAVLAAIGGAVTYTVQGSNLRLDGPDGHGLHLTAAA